MSDSMFGTSTDSKTYVENGDHDRFAHYVDKESITEAIVNGLPCIALCGKVWIPSRDPDKYPVCPECKKRFEQMGS
jgi:hypothetical protein